MQEKRPPAGHEPEQTETDEGQQERANERVQEEAARERESDRGYQ